MVSGVKSFLKYCFPVVVSCSYDLIVLLKKLFITLLIFSVPEMIALHPKS